MKTLMKTALILVLGAFVFSTILFAGCTESVEEQTIGLNKEMEKGKNANVSGKITEINRVAETVTIDKTKLLVIPQTKIFLNNKLVSLDAIDFGMEATATYDPSTMKAIEIKAKIPAQATY